MKITKQEIVNWSRWSWISIDESGLNTEIFQSEEMLTEEEAEEFLVKRAENLSLIVEDGVSE